MCSCYAYAALFQLLFGPQAPLEAGGDFGRSQFAVGGTDLDHAVPVEHAALPSYAATSATSGRTAQRCRSRRMLSQRRKPYQACEAARRRKAVARAEGFIDSL